MNTRSRSRKSVTMISVSSQACLILHERCAKSELWGSTSPLGSGFATAAAATEPVIGLTIYETDCEVTDLSTNSEVRCCKYAGCVKALFPVLRAFLGGSGAISSSSSHFLFSPSTRRSRRSCDGVAGTQQIVHRPSGRFRPRILTPVMHRSAHPKAHFSPFRFSSSSYSRFRGLKGPDFRGKTPPSVSVGVDSREFQGSVQ